MTINYVLDVCESLMKQNPEYVPAAMGAAVALAAVWTAYRQIRIIFG